MWMHCSSSKEGPGTLFGWQSWRLTAPKPAPSMAWSMKPCMPGGIPGANIMLAWGNSMLGEGQGKRCCLLPLPPFF